MVYRGLMQFRFLPTSAARAAFGERLSDLAVAASRAIARADKGLKVAHLQFKRGKDLVAVCSRVRGDGEVEIEIDVGNRQLPAVVFTDNEMKRPTDIRAINGGAPSARTPAPFFISQGRCGSGTRSFAERDLRRDDRLRTF